MANEALHISFDNGFGTLGNVYNVGSPQNGEIVLTGNSGVMEWASGPSSGHGYGTYTVEAKLEGTEPGAGIIFWPGDNKWPGQELDLAEIAQDGSGRIYGTVHWNANGNDSYSYELYDGIYTGGFHDFTMIWEAGKITYQVDGQTKAVFTDHVPADFDHGGMNNTIGFLNNNGDTSITVRDVTYTPLGETAQRPAAPAASAPIVAAAPEQTNASSGVDASFIVSDTSIAATGGEAAVTAATTVTAGGWDWPADEAGAIDWNAVAAQVHANYEATGYWFI